MERQDQGIQYRDECTEPRQQQKKEKWLWKYLSLMPRRLPILETPVPKFPISYFSQTCLASQVFRVLRASFLCSTANPCLLGRLFSPSSLLVLYPRTACSFSCTIPPLGSNLSQYVTSPLDPPRVSSYSIAWSTFSSTSLS